jgi:hypothetical protein
VVLKKIKICLEEGCKNEQTTKGFCRLHYLKNWKRIREEGEQKAATRLNRYVEGIVRNHPDRYMEVIRKDIRERKELGSLFDRDGEEEVEGVISDLGYPDEGQIDKMITHLKYDKDFS